jgi:hypothetical protein
MIKTIPGAGHSPNVEKPRQTARPILQFAAQAGTVDVGRAAGGR